MEGQFLVRQIYEDEITYNLIGAAVEILSKKTHSHLSFIKIDVIIIMKWWIIHEIHFSLAIQLNEDIPADAILELFGKTFFEFCQDSGYDKILQVLGATPRDFLQVN